MGSYADRLAALEQTWSEWARIGAELPEADWRRPTRCEPWQVAQLYAHHSSFPNALGALVSTGEQPAALSAADVLRGFNAPGGEAHVRATAVADRAATVAAEHTTDELVDVAAAAGDPLTVTPRSRAGRPTSRSGSRPQGSALRPG